MVNVASPARCNPASSPISNAARLSFARMPAVTFAGCRADAFIRCR